jgi:hypothetical protein
MNADAGTDAKRLVATAITAAIEYVFFTAERLILNRCPKESASSVPT